ncbi:inositol monophosphatase [Isoptericola sp. b441]|uniref:Inositol monophosphatase n=1 Tax=Actinotalea lenta TaxID=3064654 RepID=A0ABT9D4R4_9CELL|nr:inositol monophosphatase [Isoptericola sp. b441]MDO8105661.1 inositol monophosphatase [Isoptericola sp. b441]
MRVDVDAVTALVEHVAYQVVLPRFGHLASGDVADKAPGDLVTVVDTAAEAAIVEGLTAIAPDVPVVGEEAVAADPAVLDALGDSAAAFVVDPIDGTRAFVEGRPDYAVMVALVVRGEPVAGWICLPSRATTWVGERGSGVFRDGTRVAPPARPEVPRVRVSPRRGGRPDATALPGLDLAVEGPLWCGRFYGDVAGGTLDGLGYWGGWPWDHAPGTVLVRELGGAVVGIDGADYRPVGRWRGPLVVAAEPGTASLLRAAMQGE